MYQAQCQPQIFEHFVQFRRLTETNNRSLQWSFSLAHMNTEKILYSAKQADIFTSGGSQSLMCIF